MPPIIIVDISDAEEIIDRIKRMLAEAQAELDKGLETLKNLNDTARNMSEQALEMQQLAKKARELANGWVSVWVLPPQVKMGMDV